MPDMEKQNPTVIDFLRSTPHLWFVLGVLGASLVSAEIVNPIASLVFGATLYALGLVYLPDSPFFKRYLSRQTEKLRRESEEKKLSAFRAVRDAQIISLSDTRRARYDELVRVCKDIETATADNNVTSDLSALNAQLRKLDELMWTYLRLLSIEQTLEVFLETERRDDIPALCSQAEQELAALTTELEKMKTGNAPVDKIQYKERLLSSRTERLAVLKKRLERIDQAKSNIDILISEQQRLAQQIKLIRADSIASRNTEALSSRIDASVQHLDQTNKWLSEMSEFKDIVGDIPDTESRVGFADALPPEEQKTKPRTQKSRTK